MINNILPIEKNFVQLDIMTDDLRHNRFGVSCEGHPEIVIYKTNGDWHIVSNDKNIDTSKYEFLLKYLPDTHKDVMLHLGILFSDNAVGYNNGRYVTNGHYISYGFVDDFITKYKHGFFIFSYFKNGISFDTSELVLGPDCYVIDCLKLYKYPVSMFQHVITGFSSLRLDFPLDRNQQ